MENKDTPVFPFSEALDGLNNHRSGLTKREYFAAMALQGVISHYGLPERYENVVNPDSINSLTSGCILVADELLKQLENGE